uniref:Uncharacterized protein n=1 Tax=Bactrocera latifrons TaxID=174628 RepID=A0A0K8VNA8_BACLA
MAFTYFPNCLLLLQRASRSSYWKFQATPGPSRGGLTNGEEVFLFDCFPRQVLRRILTELERFRPFGRLDLASVAAAFYSKYDIRRCANCAKDHKSSSAEPLLENS